MTLSFGGTSGECLGAPDSLFNLLTHPQAEDGNVNINCTGNSH